MTIARTGNALDKRASTWKHSLVATKMKGGGYRARGNKHLRRTKLAKISVILLATLALLHPWRPFILIGLLCRFECEVVQITNIKNRPDSCLQFYLLTSAIVGPSNGELRDVVQNRDELDFTESWIPALIRMKQKVEFLSFEVWGG